MERKMSKFTGSYLKLTEVFERVINLKNIAAVLNWDNAVILPSGAMKDRSYQLAAIDGIYNEILQSNELSDILQKTEENTQDLSPIQKRNLQLMRKMHDKAKILDKNLQRKFIMAANECEHMWRQARQDNDFSTYAFFLRQVFDLKMEITQAEADSKKLPLYDAMIDNFEEGFTTEKIDIVFDKLKQFLPDFIDSVINRQNSTKINHFESKKGGYPQNAQYELGRKLMKQLGFNEDIGRLDISAHPFCGGTASDVRITTKYDENDFSKALMGILHETGHALYEQNLPRDYIYQPVGQALGMVIHESQSLLVEMQLCRSREFLRYLSPILMETFGNNNLFAEDNLYQNYNFVKKDFIRIDADELTYPLHVIIRYEIERELVARNIKITELPEIWNDLYKKYLGINVPNDKVGCMQDIHWTDGSFGYFPCYSLGAIAASQFYSTMFNELSQQGIDIKREIEQGKFSQITTWLARNVHEYGNMYNADGILQKVTGKGLDVDSYINYLLDKYGK